MTGAVCKDYSREDAEKINGLVVPFVRFRTGRATDMQRRQLLAPHGPAPLSARAAAEREVPRVSPALAWGSPL